MGILDRFEDEYVDVSSGRASIRELLELFAGSIVFVLIAGGVSWYLLGETVARWVVVALAVIFAITLVSQAYWAITGRADYDDETR